MRLTDLQRRENVRQIVMKTLSAEWSRQLGREVTLHDDVNRRGQTWKEHGLLGAYFTPNVGGAARRFLADSFRNTPRLTFKLPQWFLGTALCSSYGLRKSSRFAFRVRPEIPNDAGVLVVAGNQRIRVFDFSRNRVHVVLKRGFDPRTMLTEIEVRGPGQHGPFPAMRECDPAGKWFEEDIIPGFSLPRCPPWVSRRAAEERAFGLLDAWLAGTRHPTSAQVRCSSLVASIEQNVIALTAKFGTPVSHGLLPWASRLAQAAVRLGQVDVARVHGDFQGGNIIVSPSTHDITLIDWEHSQERMLNYDHMVYGLRSRQNRGIVDRMARFVFGRPESWVLEKLPKSESWRAGTVALFLLEDLEWYTRENLTGAFHTPGEGLTQYENQLHTSRRTLLKLLEKV